MRKCIFNAFLVGAMLLLSSYGFIALNKVKVPEALRVTDCTIAAYPKSKSQLQRFKILPPYLGSQFIGFKEALAFKESQGDYFVVNTYGYLGKYQFGVNTLSLMGVHNGTEFLNNPALQEKVFDINTSRNKWILRRDIVKFQGKYIGGTEITESGILAAAHLAGAGNVKRFLRSLGKVDVVDGYGTSIASYIKKFSGFDTSLIDAVRNPRI